MRVLVTGGKGQLGRAFGELLERRGIPFVLLGREDLDITNFAKVREIVLGGRFTHIVNCAAYTRVDEAEREWKRAYLVNGLGVRYLALAAEACGAVLVHFSSDYVFDGEKGAPYTIFDVPNPINRYGESKLLGEREVSLAGKWLLIRTSWVFGAGGMNFPKKVLLWAKDQEKLRIAQDEVSAPTYVEDLASATLSLMEKGALGLFHVSGNPASRFEWAAYILKLVGWKGILEGAPLAEFNLPARRPRFSVLDPFGLWETAGIILPSWEEGTERFLRREGFL
ncbi:dTDP-4-dehydrorhamnose reductase [Candidatus Caldatribacterium sp.]|uniref:dTDP-4-dehydrorhamnose reductase n=1 Tax=Candidatus Caldatribacterium sp. TaxID=2282143 RepID=UPI002995672A|nr:dTDP-4-dehydrorhamnose reductase [Candidatus Caldatribacterium sp.]MDW8082039.1 dTDP-4-dehydrorhamnose reductase [Candidatus Calescibacterium sp.]